MKNTLLFLNLFLFLNVSFGQWNDITPSVFGTDITLNTDIEVVGSDIYVASLNSSLDITVYSFIGNVWSQLGNVVASNAQEFDLTVINNQPYIVIRDNAQSITVNFFNGTNWVNILTSSNTMNGQLNLLNYNSQPLFVFQNNSTDLPEAILYDGSNWNSLGTFNLVGQEAWNINAVSLNGVPYISFREFELVAGSPVNNLKAMQYDGTSWTYIGNSIELLEQNSDGSNPSIDSDLILDVVTNRPTIAYVESVDAMNSAARVLKVEQFDGINWNLVGDSLVDAFSFEKPNLDILNNDLVVTYGRDFIAPINNNSRIVSFIYNGVIWNPLGTDFFVTPDGATNSRDQNHAMAGNGNSLYVSYVEDFPSNGILKVVEFDGSALSIIDNETNSTFYVYPNPMKDILHIESKFNISTINLFSVDGKKIKVKLNNNTLNVGHLSSGIYLLNIIVQGNTSKTVRIIKK